MKLPGDGSFQAFVDSFVVREAKETNTLIEFLRGFAIFIPGVA